MAWLKNRIITQMGWNQCLRDPVCRVTPKKIFGRTEKGFR